MRKRFSQFQQLLALTGTEKIPLETASGAYRWVLPSLFQGNQNGNAITLISGPQFAISSGDETQFGGFNKEDAFNERYDLVWLSALDGSAMINSAFIGQNFGATKTVKRIEISQTGQGNTDTNRMITDAVIQSSVNGTDWVDVKAIKFSRTYQVFDSFETDFTAQFVRILATSSCAFGWHVHKVRIYGF